MISLKAIRIKAFRSFVDETHFDLPTSGLILINGKNLLTNDASGTGKSTIFLATAFALNILPAGQTAAGLQSFLTKEKMQVTLWLTGHPSGTVIVARGRETYIEYNGAHMEGATLVNEHLEKVFGLTSEMLFTMAYRPQNSGGLFLSKTDSEKKEFLTSLLGLDKIESAIEDSDKTVKELTKELISINGQLKAKEDVLTQFKFEDVSALEADTVALNAEILDMEADREYWEGKLSVATKTMNDENARIDAKYSDLKKQAKEHIKQLQLMDGTRRSLIEDSNKKKRFGIAETQKKLTLARAAKTELAKVDAEIVKLESSICPTCSREWLESQDKLAKTKETQKELIDVVQQESGLEVLLEVLEEEIETYVVDPLIAAMQEVFESLDASANGERVIGTGSGEMNMLSKNYRKMQELTTKVSANAVKISKQKELKMLHGSVTKEVGLLQVQKATKESKLQYETDFCKVVGKEGFLGGIFDEVLAEIVQEINNKLSTVANMSTVTFDFKTEVLNTKGVVKKAIVPMVTIQGHESKLGALSGGMLSSLEIITDLAVKEVIERRTGKQIGFYFIDEAFNGIGKPSVEACLDILSQSANTKAFYLIDHNSETKEVFSQVIEIEMENGVSRLK